MDDYKLSDKVSKFEDLDLSGTYSYADYLKWEFDERLELIRGKIFRMSPGPNTVHQVVVGVLYYNLYKFLKEKPCRVFIAPFDVRFPRRSKEDQEIMTVLQPDLCVICDPAKVDARGGYWYSGYSYRSTIAGQQQKRIKE